MLRAGWRGALQRAGGANGVMGEGKGGFQSAPELGFDSRASQSRPLLANAVAWDSSAHPSRLFPPSRLRIFAELISVDFGAICRVQRTDSRRIDPQFRNLQFAPSQKFSGNGFGCPQPNFADPNRCKNFRLGFSNPELSSEQFFRQKSRISRQKSRISNFRVGVI